MSESVYYIDDRFNIPECIKNMSHEQRQKEIARLEAEAAGKKRQKEKFDDVPDAV